MIKYIFVNTILKILFRKQYYNFINYYKQLTNHKNEKIIEVKPKKADFHFHKKFRHKQLNKISLAKKISKRKKYLVIKVKLYLTCIYKLIFILFGT